MYVEATNIKVVNQAEITATITPPACEPTESDLLVVANDFEQIGLFPVQIAGSPAPTITDVKPRTWLAGKTYDNVVLKGTGFIARGKATANCPATPVNIIAADGNVVPISNVHVASKTKITLTVAPQVSNPTDPTQTATVTAGTATFNPAYILGNQILCDPSMNCTQPVISTTDGSTPPTQTVVVGQPIILTTNPKLPVTPYKTTWTVGGTNIDSLKSTIKGFKTKKTVLGKANAKFYWELQGTSIPVTYQYCADIPYVGKQCSPIATAEFNVNGPNSVNLYTCGGNVTGCSQYGPLGSVAITPGPKLSLGNTSTNIGIVFNASYDASSPPGTFSFVQLIGNYTTTYSYKSGRSCSYDFGSGLDNSNPYPPDSDTIADDNPDTTLYANDTEVKANMTATMYLLWTSSVSGSIPVPLGYVDWSWFGDAVRDESTKTWSIKPDSGSQGNAGSYQSNSTYPSWDNVLHNGANPCAK
jgi:hypothetical protein